MTEQVVGIIGMTSAQSGTSTHKSLDIDGNLNFSFLVALVMMATPGSESKYERIIEFRKTKCFLQKLILKNSRLKII